MPGKSVLDEVHCWKGFGVYKGAIAQSQESPISGHVFCGALKGFPSLANCCCSCWMEKVRPSLTHSLTHTFCFSNQVMRKKLILFFKRRNHARKQRVSGPIVATFFFSFFSPVGTLLSTSWHHVNHMAPQVRVTASLQTESLKQMCWSSSRAVQ